MTAPHDVSPLQPFAHGPFLVDPDGAMQPRGWPALRFAWRGRACEARLADGRLRLSAAAGALPYTAECVTGRTGAVAAIGRLPSELPRGWLLRVLPDHRLKLEAERALPAPVTATALLGALVGFALDLDPYLDLLASAGIVAGTAKT